jgi:quercetin dioxygenase-like cupin family protein
MRRFSFPRSIVAVLLLGLVLTGGMRTAAQEVTPAATPATAAAPNFTVGSLAPVGETFELLPGAHLQYLIEGQPAAAPDHSMVLYRVILDGGEIPSHTHPGATVLTVESGTLSWTLQAGTATVIRPGAAPEQVTEPGTEVILLPGEGMWYNADVVHTARSADALPASVLVSSLLETGQPAFALTDEHGTPTP